ncbi:MULTISPECIES: MerR family transcriptional regulator [unclassified Streptomyces]|uniref:transcriptional regulator FtsR n=1 Tax=Streptomyces TaxID=1883 RepID=UPI00089D67CE|nr:MULTISPECIES: MerR family transcriptional regulator [unclassified Streptomyces]PJJ00457.1 DNA-binding transcriptional MerR regulator [Streptomyces sp. 2333.5]TXC98230.1 MerR family transcriptional regulator [Streptomyces sp. ISID311]SEB93966.1 DNA-binding transcriptional regulator, MerR family [Streptomyces sp. 2314.4]SEC83459.1 DNA-binding transcriptional regulator, MerR family [Streptomyces sp. 2112.2]SOE15419.1 DNA-binding transcriptional regulator, MerR family [Streptomyces sp. 2323.1]
MRHTPKGGAGPSGTASSDGKPVSIGTVLTLLREEFPEVTISKIRFLEAEGLVEPKRTPSGYRKFTPADVERLANVLRMQRDHYLPLKVIREHLDALERGEQVQLPAPATPSRDLVEGVHDAGAERPTAARIGRAELLAAAEVDEATLADWESYGLIVSHAEGGYDIEAVTVAKLVADLGRFGLEPRHLRAVKAAAEREAGLVEQVVAPLRRHRNPQTRAHAEATARELATLSVRLHAALLQSALRVRL